MNNFDDIIKDTNLLRGIYRYRYDNPYEIQTRSVLSVNQKKDTIVVSNKGKTSSLIISLLTLREIQNAIIITDNDNSVKEIKEMIIEISQYMKVSFNIHIYTETSQPDFIGEEVDIVMIDNVDKINKLVSFNRGSKVQVCLFSRDFNDTLLHFMNDYLTDISYIQIDDNIKKIKDINQYYVNVKENRYKYDVIIDFYEITPISKCIIYFDNENDMINVYQRLKNDNYPLSYISKLENRDNIIQDFTDGNLRLLLSTIYDNKINNSELTLIIHYDVPSLIDFYEKNESSNNVIYLITDNDISELLNLEKVYDMRINELPDNVNEVLR